MYLKFKIFVYILVTIFCMLLLFVNAFFLD